MAHFVSPIQGPLGSVQGCPEVRSAAMATTTVEFLSDSSNQMLKIAGILPCHGGVQEEEEEQLFARTPMYIVCTHRANSGLCSGSRAGRAFQQLRYVSVPNNVRELCDLCFCDCKGLRRVLFGSSSSLERIGVECFQGSGVKEVSIPDGVLELCDCCFEGCKSLRRVNFGCSSSLVRIGVRCFWSSGVEDVSIPDGVRELSGSCFSWCRSLRRVNFGSSSYLKSKGVDSSHWSVVE